MSENASYNVELEVFEGPLDLLLHLVRKHELDIMDIPISFVTDKYLEYLDMMEKLNLDIAGEYLLMAATLAHIKSRELLPQQEVEDEAEEGLDGEDGVDPRQELIRRLLEYQKYKEAAESLGEQPVVGRNVWPRGTKRDDAVAGQVDQDAQAPLAEIPGIVPALSDLPPGCAFAPRCPLATPRCAERPPLAEQAPGHWAACGQSDLIQADAA